MAPERLRYDEENEELNLKLKIEKNCVMMWKTLFIVDSKYVPKKPIGRGSFGVVCSFINAETQEMVAIKKIDNVFENRVEALRAFREIVILRNVSHQNVIGLKDVMVANSSLISNGLFGDSMANFKEVYLVYELMDTDLNQIIMSSQPISNDHFKYFLFQLLSGLKYLHSANIIHRDLKPGNLLVNAKCDLKICDFGLSRSIAGDVQFLTEHVGTRWYRAPELLLCCEGYGPTADIWSVGCIFAELLGRRPIFPGTDCLTQLKLIISILGTQDPSNLMFVDSVRSRGFLDSLPYTNGAQFSCLYSKADPLAIDLLQKMLVFDPTKRISACEALTHPYFVGLYDQSNDFPDPFPLDLELDDCMEEEMIRELIWSEMMCYRL